MKQTRLTMWMGAVIMAVMVSQAKTNYVDASVSGGSASGTSWANAYSQLWQAVGSAAASDAVWVAQGTYAPTNTNDPNATFLLAKTGLRIYGGFASGMTSLTQRDWTSYPTVLTGEIQNDGLQANNSIHIITITNAIVSNIVLDGLILTNGYSDGGALYGNNGIPGIQVLNCVFANNNGGAAVYDNNSFSPTFSNCLFQSNAKAMHNNSASSPSLFACRFEYNSAGAMRNDYSSSPSLSGCFFGTNTALAGGAMYNYYNSSPSLKTCQFIGNVATNGGAIYNEAAGSACKPAWSNCLFSLNMATGTVYGGGAVYNKSCSPTYTDCQFLRNSATNQGGAVFAYSPVAPTATDTFTRCTFAANQGLKGGGAGYYSYSRSLFKDCTIAANAASNGNGGGVYLFAIGDSGTFGNCMFSDNRATVGGAVYVDTASLTATNCVFCGNQGAGAVAHCQAPIGLRSMFKNTLFCGNVSASYGGVLSLQWNQPFVTVSNCTFAGNAAATYGGVVYMDYLQASQDVSIANSIFWGNSAPSGGSVFYGRNPYTITATVSMAYSDIAGGWNGANVVTAGAYAAMVVITNRGGNINRDPQFTPPQTGVWTSAEIQDPAMGQTRFTNANANWPVNALQGLPLQPNTASACQYLVVTNTPTTVTVWGLVTLGGLTPYAVRDLHLWSTGGRWTPGNAWVKDSATSPCIDTGDPLASCALEPPPNGGRINMGFDGNTAQASKTAAGGTMIMIR